MAQDALEVSVVFPCLNEAETLEKCIRGAWAALEAAQVAGEVVVADNGSTDGSQAIARAGGARLVDAAYPGYGSALRAGLKQARGRYLVFLDADMSYDCADIPAFVEALRAGADVVIGSRLRGRMDPGAMPVLHRTLGTPVMTTLANVLFGCGISDINCGMRGITREAFHALDLHADGMEFASEIMIKAAQQGMRVVETPIRFHADERTRAPHLQSFQDGWRHLQLMMHFCSMAWFLVPGVLLTGGGAAVILFGAGRFGGFGVMLLAQAAMVLGTLIAVLGLIAQGRVRGSKHKLRGETATVRLMRRWVKVEKGVAVGLVIGLAGGVALLGGAGRLAQTGPHGGQVLELSVFPARVALLGAAVLLCGIAVFFSSLFMGLFGIRVEDDSPRGIRDGGEDSG